MLSKKELIYLGAALIFNSSKGYDTYNAVDLAKYIYNMVFDDEEDKMILE